MSVEIDVVLSLGLCLTLRLSSVNIIHANSTTVERAQIDWRGLAATAPGQRHRGSQTPESASVVALVRATIAGRRRRLTGIRRSLR